MICNNPHITYSLFGTVLYIVLVISGPTVLKDLMMHGRLLWNGYYKRLTEMGFFDKEVILLFRTSKGAGNRPPFPADYRFSFDEEPFPLIILNNNKEFKLKRLFQFHHDKELPVIDKKRFKKVTNDYGYMHYEYGKLFKSMARGYYEARFYTLTEYERYRTLTEFENA